ncbi:MAG: ABC transporter substrate-binding protein [Dehalococcoidia bacterium]|nr:ABC transporter substrate-binding protein [Dehalococcoidia bacterium]
MRTVMAALFLLLAVALAAACGDGGGGGGGGGISATASPAVSAFPVTVSNSDGTKTTLSSAPQRIISLSPAATETFCALGLGDQLVAVEKYENCPHGSKAKPEVDAFKPNLEGIVSYRPDLVFVSSDSGGSVDGLRRANIPVVYLKVPTTLDGVLQQITLFGQFTGQQRQGDELTRTIRGQLDEVKRRIADVGAGPRVYHELTATFYSAAPSSFVGDFYTQLKAKNIAEGANTEYPQLTAEVIIQRDPEVIVLSGEEGGRTVESVKTRAGWGQVSAVKNNRVCHADPDLTSRPGPRIANAMTELGRCLYPERFR